MDHCALAFASSSENSGTICKWEVGAEIDLHMAIILSRASLRKGGLMLEGILIFQELDSSARFNQMTHCLGMSYYVNFLGGLDSNEFHIK